MNKRVEGNVLLLRAVAGNTLLKPVVRDALTACAVTMLEQEQVVAAARAYIVTDAAKAYYSADETPAAVQRLFDAVINFDRSQQ